MQFRQPVAATPGRQSWSRRPRRGKKPLRRLVCSCPWRRGVAFTFYDEGVAATGATASVLTRTPKWKWPPSQAVTSWLCRTKRCSSTRSPDAGAMFGAARPTQSVWIAGDLSPLLPAPHPTRSAANILCKGSPTSGFGYKRHRSGCYVFSGTLFKKFSSSPARP